MERAADRVPVWVVTGLILAGLGVAFGAFGAHALRDLVSVDRLATFETAVRYQSIHAMALLFGGLLATMHAGDAWLSWALRLIAAGILVFSGSLYLLVLLDAGWLGAVTPAGGVLLIAGYACFVVAAVRMRRPLRTGG